MNEPPEEPVRPPHVPADAIRRVIRVPPEWAGRRLDVFLKEQLRNTSRTRARAIIEASAYSPSGKRLRANDRVRAEDRVVLWRMPFDEDFEPPDLPILFEDEHLLVVNKPPLVTVHPTARYYKSTVIKQLELQRSGFLSLIHRLDRETSGILLVAKTRESDRAFKRLLEDRSHAVTDTTGRRRSARIEKTYVALVHGEPESGLVDLPLEQDPDNPLRVKMRIAARGDGLEARTGVQVLERRQREGSRYARVSCRLFTGRQHQIRVHLAALGCTVVGDKLYGSDDRMLARAADGELTEADLVKLELPRQALHAARYELPHAITGDDLDLRAPLPDDMREFWDRLSPCSE